jgi:sensor histidine kinase YesM
MSQVPQHGGSPLGGYIQSGWFMEFAKFKKMITPVVIQVLFWLLVAACLIMALVSFGQAQILTGIVTLVLGPLFVRIYCELLILAFRIRDLLEEISKNTKR